MPDNKKDPVRRDAYICSAFQLHTAKEGTTPVLNSDDTFFFFASRLFCDSLFQGLSIICVVDYFYPSYSSTNFLGYFLLFFVGVVVLSPQLVCFQP